VWSCFRSGHRSRFFYRLHVYHGRRGQTKTFTWQDYRDLIVMTHLQLGTPVVWVWDILSVHLMQQLHDFAEENKYWLLIFQLPSYAPDLNPQEWLWSLKRRAMVNFVTADLTGLVRIMDRKLKKIQYRPDLVDGCLAGTAPRRNRASPEPRLAGTAPRRNRASPEPRLAGTALIIEPELMARPTPTSSA